MLSKRNRELIGFFAAGAAAIIAAGWAVFVYLVPPDASKQPMACNIAAEQSAAACGNVSGNINIGTTSGQSRR